MDEVFTRHTQVLGPVLDLIVLVHVDLAAVGPLRFVLSSGIRTALCSAERALPRPDVQLCCEIRLRCGVRSGGSQQRQLQLKSTRDGKLFRAPRVMRFARA